MARRALSSAGVAAGLGLFMAAPAAAAEWWMLHQTETGRVCAPSLEVDGVALTPRAILADHPECKLTNETPSQDLDTVMINCEGRIGRVFVFTRSKAACERLIAE
ncbi:hypothetical protein W911_02815 [Hyphomicrobium nitrativorans NL23]|uniref:Uncharacterized protein n=1 Tax=Hyphomicrobium nitrativorans NL23 TaxID=1029756 RepID=V5SH63_9HYPH|nr:hypothetical protein [Hyphomicrobium nitrativorans]AHB49868.1 hypothetical protein W911_02815 [Hyphomicrobium nitrativorans NL23]